MAMSAEQFKELMETFTNTMGKFVGSKNTPGAIGSNNFIETMNKNLDKLDVKQFKDWKFKVEMDAKSVHHGYWAVAQPVGRQQG